MESSAVFSGKRAFRYLLIRIWDRKKPKCAFIGLNPSTADETMNDPTVSRCVNYAREWGYGGLYMLNIFGFRATDPKAMKAHLKPIGRENDEYLLKIARYAGIVICAWGTHGVHMDRHDEVMRMLLDANVDLHCLGETKHGYPKHPLYLRKDQKPEPYFGTT